MQPSVRSGIDLYWDKTTLDIQVDAFQIQLGWANEYNLPISIHSRDSTREITDVLSENREILTGGVMHCFTGSSEEAEEAISLGFVLGFGGSSTYKNTTLIPVIESIPLDKIVLETDAPYLTPVPHRGKRNEDAYIPLIAQRLADIRNISTFISLCHDNFWVSKYGHPSRRSYPKGIIRWRN